jgi:hypothetical protein
MVCYGDFVVTSDPPECLTTWSYELYDQQKRIFEELIKTNQLPTGKRFALGWKLEVLDDGENPSMFRDKIKDYE